ncbi:MAG: PASTA domain-containing protein, partial [Pseudomonadota bacterium]
MPPSIGGSANSEPDLEPGDLAVMFHYMHENPFNNGGTPAGPTGTTLSAQVTGNRRNLFIATRVLQAGDIVSGTYTPDAFQHVYDAGEGAHNSYVAIVVVRQALVAPTYTQIPNVSSRSDVAYTLTAEMTANCSLYAVAVEKDVTAPTIAQVKAGNDSGDTAAIAAANKAFSEDTADSMELGGTLAFPIHDVYAVAANSAGDATLVSLTGEQLEPAIGKQHVTLSLVGITGVANTNPAEVTAPGHGFATGQQIRIFGVTGMTEVNSPAPVNGIADFHTLTSIDGNTFSLDGVDATSFPAYSGGGHVAPGVSTLETVSPPASDGDIAVADSVTRPGGYAVTFHTDGTFSYAANGDDSRQSILVAVYDVSAATLSPAATSAANNAGPTLIDAPIPVQLWRQGIAIDPLDFSALVGDREGDVLSWALVGAPAWMLLTDAVLSGTPDIGVTSDNVVLTATDSLGYSTDFTVDYSIADTAIVPDVVGTSLAAAIDALEAAGFDNIAFASTQTGAVAIGEVALQDPSATTVHSTDDPVLLTVKETIAVAVAASPDVAGVVSTRRPIPSPEIVWAAVPDYSNQPQAVAFSEDVRGLLSGAGAATAVISVADVSGDSAAALGLSISGGDNLASGAATLGAGVFRLQATFGGVDYLSGSFTFSVVSNVSDTLAPTEPLPESWAAVGTDQVDLTILPPSDPISPASTVSGLNEVEIHSRQGGGSYSLLTTKAVGPGLSLQLVRSTIGSVGGVPSSSQSGPDYSLTAQSGGQNGRGLIGVADGLEVWAGSVSGDFDVSVKVEELIGVVGAFSAAYLMVRESLATDAKVIAASSRTDDSDGSNVRCQMQYRDTTGGNLISETAVQNVFGDRYLRIKRQGNTLTAYYWQPGLTGWVPLGARTIPMTDAVQVCLSCAPRSNDSSTLTAQFREFSVTNLPLISHSDLGLTPNSEYYYKARARDVDLNLGDFGPEVSVVLSGTGGGGSARYTDVTFSPPVLSSPTTYTTYTSLPSSFAGSFRSGVEHCGGLVHRFVGNATNPGDLLIDLSGDAGHACIYPIWVQDWRHVYIIGVNALMSTQSGCEVGQLDNRDDSGTKNHYPRLPAGAYNIKSDIVGHLFVEGCYWDANGHEGDYLIYRNKRGVPADRPNMIVTFQNCMFVGNEGQPQAVHS